MRTALAVLLSLLLLIPSASASFHFMQIEQIVGGVNGDVTAQAIQLRMRTFDQHLVSQGRLLAYDANGANPVLLLNIASNVTNDAAGAHILFATASFSTYCNITPDFTLANPIPQSYLAGGKITFEQDVGGILWSVAFGNYVGSNTGLVTNDSDGNFGAPFASALPSTNLQALLFQGAAVDLSTTNVAQYALSALPATFTNNAGTSANLHGVLVNSTTTTFSSTPSPTIYGQTITIVVDVAPAGATSETPSGTVNFMSGGNSIGSAPLVSARATFTTSTLPAGVYSIVPTYAGDANFNGSAATAIPFTVNKDNTVTATFSSTPSPVVFGQPVTIVVDVTATSSAAVPTGAVNFQDSATPIGSASLVNGRATFTTSALSLGGHSITPSYGGDANFNTSSTSAIAYTVQQASSTTNLVPSKNPSSPDEAVTFTATVSAVAPSIAVPTGTVDFKDGSTVLATVTLTNGVAAFSTSALSLGDHLLTAVFSSDANITGSTSSVLTQNINAAPVFTSGPAASVSVGITGQEITFTAAGTDPDGTNVTVSWSFGDASIASGSPVSHTYVAAGTYTVTATITDGSGNFTNTTLSLQVVALAPGGAIDTDGDGFSDDIEIAAGTSASNAADTPFGGQPAGETQVLTISKLAIKLNFAKAGNDSIQLSGTLPVSAGFASTGAKVLVDVGGVARAFTLDAKGKSTPKGTDSFKITVKATRGVVAAQTSKYAMKVSKGNFASALAGEGLTNADAKGSEVSVSVTVVFNGALYQTTRAQLYSAKAGKTGASKDKK